MGNPSSTNGSLILVLGILGLVLCPVFGLIAWSMGTSALRTLEEEGDDGAERGLVAAGRVCGIIAVVLFFVTMAVWGISLNTRPSISH